MARIIVGSYLVRYPLGGNVSCVLQYLSGFQKLGHDVYFVEKSGYPNSCYDPIQNQMTHDCSYGVAAIRETLKRIGMEGRFCYVDEQNRYHGLSRNCIENIFKSADVFVEMGTHEAWLQESSWAKLRILVDGDPGFSQIWMDLRISGGEAIPKYDRYFTVGSGVGTSRSSAPTAGEKWSHVFHPVLTEMFPVRPANPDASFTTVMNWESYKTVVYRGETYGHKNLEFDKFMELPRRTRAAMEVAVAGSNVPTGQLETYGWRVRHAHPVTISLDAFLQYLQNSKGEFSVCKNGFVAMQTGWFGDRSSAYLASGRPVIMQDTGFGYQLPCGKGLFAVKSVEEAAAAIAEITRDYATHSRAAREIAEEYLDAPKVMRRLLHEIGV